MSTIGMFILYASVFWVLIVLWIFVASPGILRFLLMLLAGALGSLITAMVRSL